MKQQCWQSFASSTDWSTSPSIARHETPNNLLQYQFKKTSRRHDSKEARGLASSWFRTLAKIWRGAKCPQKTRRRATLFFAWRILIGTEPRRAPRVSLSIIMVVIRFFRPLVNEISAIDASHSAWIFSGHKTFVHRAFCQLLTYI